jgi:L-lysine 6-transaminase
MLADGFDFVLDLDASQGSYLVDAKDGRKYLDFFTFIASNPIGMNHPGLNNDDFIRQIGKVALHKPSNSDMYTVEMAQFVETLFRIAVPDHFSYAFFIEGGALAVENALKTAMDWKVRKNVAAGRPETVGTKVCHFRKAFHGRSGYTMSLTNTDPTKVRYFPKFTDWPRISNPYAEYPLEGEALDRTVEREELAVKELRAAFEANPHDICCVIIEPIQGEGGDNHFRSEFFAQLRSLCDEFDAMLILDEVQTGVGLTGEWWAHQAIGVKPDIIAFGKKSQVCGILVGDRVDTVKDNVFHTPSRINSTWGGNLVDMVRFTRFLEIIDEEDLVANAKSVGQHLQTELQKLAHDFPSILSNPRGLGLMCAITARDRETRQNVLEGVYARGLLMVGAGEQTLRFRPPLNLSKAEADEGIGILRDTLSALSAE